MLNERAKLISRLILAVAVLLSGIAFLPFTTLSAERLTWQRYAGIYQPELTIVPNSGQPGSAFVFTGSGYPVTTQATIYIEAQPVGSIMTDAHGEATFAIQTLEEAVTGTYYVTLSTGPNASATQSFTLDANEPLIPLPPGFLGLVIELVAPMMVFLPIVTK